MELIIDKNGKAVDFEDVSVTIICESKEEADRMREGMVSGRVRLMEWVPIKYIILDGTKAMSMEEKPAEGDMVLCTDGLEVWPDIFINGGFGGFFQSDDATAWMRMPAPYKPKEGEA